MTIGGFIREWDDTQFASSVSFVPTWAIGIIWENIKHLDYPGLVISWPVAEHLSVGSFSGSQVNGIDLAQFSDVISQQKGEQVYQLHKAIGNSGLPGKWLFRLDSNNAQNQEAKKICYEYYTQNKNIRLDLDLVKQCPDRITSLESLQFQGCDFDVPLSYPSWIFGYPKRDLCLTQKIIYTNPVITPGSYCSYDTDGFLKASVSHLDVWSSTVVQKFPPRYRQFGYTDDNYDWQGQDLDFRYQCCIASGSEDFCDFYTSVRPSPSEGYRVEHASAGVYGAGHYKTFDGISYSFNGLGEYVLLRMEEAGLEIQARSGSRETGPDETRTTVITGIAIELENDQLEVHMTNMDPDVQVKINGNVIPLTELKGYSINNNILVSWGSDPWNTTANVVDVILIPQFATSLTGEIFIQIRPVSGSLVYLMTMDKMIFARGSTEGLFGIFNEDSSDDLRFPDGSQLAFTDQDELTNEFVFPFGESWRTTPGTSLFVYELPTSWFTNNDVDFEPTFYSEIGPESQLFSVASDLCQGITECMYDFLVLKDRNVASSSRKIKEIFDREKRIQSK
ncbi:Sushi domain-containing protein 2 [Holothuria leucospilota]|uniref:Sushi domain-containing protein 2 n=1 Tax=Holothuria leucospilota TaxID=206669 RepID=A0A9Q1C1X1_HOLLE|nr:Sushi domain-containing protein 2 [Holothuria leucospilota]